MKIGFVTPSISRKGGGLLDAVRRIAQELLLLGEDVVVYSCEDEYSREDAALWRPVPLCLFATIGPSRLGYSAPLRKAVLEADHDVLLTNGMWHYLSAVAVEWHSRTGRPYMVNPHGMLQPWALAHSGLRKKVAAALYENRHLRNASCIRVLGEAEANAVREYGLTNPLCVIPNGVDLPLTQSKERNTPWPKTSLPPENKVILFLGRIHPKKNIPELLEAWRLVLSQPDPALQNWMLVIAGWDELQHEKKLKEQCQKLDLAKHVHFAGPLHGTAKTSAYANASAFILPSLSEGLPMTVLEAWSHELPTLITSECNLPEAFAANAAIKIGADRLSIAEALRSFITMSENERSEIARRGRQLAEMKFSWPAIAREMLQVLRWLNGDCVHPRSLTADSVASEPADRSPRLS